MMLTSNHPSPRAIAQCGMSLLSVLVAIVVFGLGMLSVASLYSLAVPAQTANQETVDTAAFGNQFWAILQSNPSVVSTIQSASGGVLSFTSPSSISGAPAPLQPLLKAVFNNTQTMLPGASVTMQTGNGAEGNPCDVSTPTAPICGVTLTLKWQAGKSVGGQRTQTFNYQVGF